MKPIMVNTSMVKAIAKRLNYRRRKVTINPAGAVTLTDLNWSDGTRSTYTAIELATGQTSAPDLGRPAPWDNKAEGVTVPVPPGMVIARTGTFCGKPSLMTIYCHPDDMPRLIEEDA